MDILRLISSSSVMLAVFSSLRAPKFSFLFSAVRSVLYILPPLGESSSFLSLILESSRDEFDVLFSGTGLSESSLELSVTELDSSSSTSRLSIDSIDLFLLTPFSLVCLAERANCFLSFFVLTPPSEMNFSISYFAWNISCKENWSDEKPYMFQPLTPSDTPKARSLKK